MTRRLERVARPWRALGPMVLALSLAACEGNLSGSGAPTSTPGMPGAAGSAGAGSQTPAECATAPSGVAPMFLRRLTNREYASTVRELLGVEPVVTALPTDITLYGFDNNAESLSLSTAHLEAYRTLAEGVAAELVASEPRRSALVGCEPAGPDAQTCLTSFIRRFGLRAFRRALLDDEVASLLALADAAPAAGGAWGGVSLVIEGLLQSPSFLWRVEQGAPAGDQPGLVALTGYEVAARLSYLLWGTMPDDALFRTAESGALGSADGVKAQALAMLDDEARALPTAWSFAGQWLRVGNLASVTRSTGDFALWSEGLRAAMVEQTRRLVEEHTRAGKPLLELLDTDKAFVDASLSPLYGVAAPAGGDWAQVTLPAEQGRRGILGQASVLTLTSNNRATTPILRGKYIRQVLLCDDLPPPPPTVPALPEAQAGLSERDRLAAHRSDPACSTCHAMLEPLGFGLSHFDAIGAYRANDAEGRPLDGHGEIAGLDDASFEGLTGLAMRLKREPKVARCLSTHLLRFALGRKEAPSDSCNVERLGAVLQAGGDFRTLVSALVQSDAFRYRLPADVAPGAKP